MFSNIRILPAIFGGLLTYPLIALIVKLVGQQEKVLLAGLFAGVLFTVISLISGRALGYFFIQYHRDTEPGKYWFLTGHFFGFIIWGSLLPISNPQSMAINYYRGF